MGGLLGGGNKGGGGTPPNRDVNAGPIRTRSQPRTTRDDRRAKKQQQRNETR